MKTRKSVEEMTRDERCEACMGIVRWAAVRYGMTEATNRTTLAMYSRITGLAWERYIA